MKLATVTPTLLLAMGSSLGCFGEENGNDTVCYVLVGVTGLSLLLLVVALIILCCVCYYRKKRRRQQRQVHYEEQVNPYAKDGKTQVHGFSEYAEVADAIYPNASGMDDCGARQSRILQSEGLKNTTEEHMSLPPMRQRSGCQSKPSLPLQLPPPNKSSIKKKPVSSSEINSHPLPARLGGATSGSTEHVYDSVDSVTTSCSTPDALLSDTATKPPPIYHVLEGPTPIADSEPATPVNTQPVPPKPPRVRHRMLSCTVLDQQESGGDCATPQVHSAVQTQLQPVMALYKGIHERERSASSILLPMHVARGATNDGATKSDNMHQVRDGPLVNRNKSRTDVKTQLEHLKKTLDVNSESVSQACDPKNAEESTVIKTTKLGFQSGLPKMPQKCSAAIQNKQPQNLLLSEKAITDNPSMAADDSMCYAEPCVHTQNDCRLFDDPAYCTQSCSGSDSQKLNSSDDSAIDTKQHSEPSYATPLRSQQDISNSSDSLFDDPKYNNPGFKPDSTTSQSLRLKMEEQRNNQAQRRHLHKCFMRSVQHSKSVDQFNPPASHLTAIHTEDHLEGKGHSLLNLSDQKKVNNSTSGSRDF